MSWDYGVIPTSVVSTSGFLTKVERLDNRVCTGRKSADCRPPSIAKHPLLINAQICLKTTFPVLMDRFVYLQMTKSQLKSEIQILLDHFPENVLIDLMEFLKALRDQPEDKIRLANDLRQILAEDKGLLEKLAK